MLLYIDPFWLYSIYKLLSVYKISIKIKIKSSLYFIWRQHWVFYLENNMKSMNIFIPKNVSYHKIILYSKLKKTFNIQGKTIWERNRKWTKYNNERADTCFHFQEDTITNCSEKLRLMQVTTQIIGTVLLSVFTHYASALHLGHLSLSHPAFNDPIHILVQSKWFHPLSL